MDDSTVPPIGPSPDVAARLLKDSRGVVEITKGAKLPGWQAQLVLREQADGEVEVEIALGSSGEAANDALLVG